MGGMMHTTQECRIGDAYKLLCEMPDESADTVITSPPYWGLRDYGVDGQIGLEPTLEEYHERLLEVTAECMRVLKPTGVMFWDHGDNYQNKCLTMQDARLIIQMIDKQSWILRNRNIWYKPNGMPSSTPDRFSNKYEHVYILVKSKKYWFDLDAVRVPHRDGSMNRWRNGGEDTGKTKFNKSTPDTAVGNLRNASNPLRKNPGDVWTIPTQPYPDSHFATFPTALIEPMIRVACPAEICPVCGLARERIIDREFVLQQDVSADKGIRGANDQKPMDDSNQWQGFPRGTTAHHTIGWTDCGCGAGWIAGTVLDPFAGRGTVGEVCRNLNRNWIGLELNPDYEKLIKGSCMAHTPPLTAYEVK